jgi:LysR family cyn operon transcriptional activator
MELRQIRYFLGVAKHLHFTRAAEQLHISQPALSGAIKLLEEELQAPLFKRIGRRVELSQAGKAFQPHATRIVQACEEGRVAVQEVVGLLRGHITVGVIHTLNAYVVPQLAARFRALAPGVGMMARAMHASEIPARVSEGQVDVGITMLPVGDPSLEERRLYQEELVLVSPPPRASRRQPSLPLKEAAHMPLVLFPPEYALRRIIDQEFASVGEQPVPTVEMPDVGGIVSAVQAGVGSTLLPLPYVRYMGLDERMPVQRLRDPNPARTVGLVMRKDRHVDPATRAFLEAAQAFAASQPRPRR